MISVENDFTKEKYKHHKAKIVKILTRTFYEMYNYEISDIVANYIASEILTKGLVITNKNPIEFNEVQDE